MLSNMARRPATPSGPNKSYHLPPHPSPQRPIPWVPLAPPEKHPTSAKELVVASPPLPPLLGRATGGGGHPLPLLRGPVVSPSCDSPERIPRLSQRRKSHGMQHTGCGRTDAPPKMNRLWKWTELLAGTRGSGSMVPPPLFIHRPSVVYWRGRGGA